MLQQSCGLTDYSDADRKYRCKYQKYIPRLVQAGLCVCFHIYIYIIFFNLSFFLYHCAKAKVKLSDSFGCLLTYSRPLRQKERVNVRTLACVYTEFEYIRASRE